MPIPIPVLLAGTLWVFVVFGLAILSAPHWAGGAPYRRTPMEKKGSTVRVDIGRPGLYARSSRCSAGEGAPAGDVPEQSQESNPRQKVALRVPYVEATVVVTGEEGRKEARRCPLYLN